MATFRGVCSNISNLGFSLDEKMGAYGRKRIVLGVMALFCIANMLHSKYGGHSGHTVVHLQQSTSSIETNQKVSCRKKHVVYIKTRKTGSSTITNMMYRQALRRDLKVLLYSYQMDLSNNRTPMYPIHLHPIFKGMSNDSRVFDFLMEHVPHNDEMILYMMPEDSVYFTSVRHPLGQLKSQIHYAHSDIERGGDPVRNFVNSRYAGKQEGSRYFMVPEIFRQKSSLMEVYLQALKKKFPVVAITEHFDESLLLLKRRYCWDLEDIVYIPLKVGHFNMSIIKYDEELLSQKLPWYNHDKMVFMLYNDSLWQNIKSEKDFFEELQQFKSIINRVATAGNRIMKLLIGSKNGFSDVVKGILASEPPIQIAASKWNQQFSIDSTDLLLMMLDKRSFRGIFISRQIPDICNHPNLITPARTMRETSMSGDTFALNPAYCDNIRLKYDVQFNVLLNKSSYDLFH